MYRRSVIALAAAVPLAGCSGILPGGGVETTLGEDELVEFDADGGDELTVSIDVDEVFPLGDDDGGETDLEREGISFRLDHAENGIVDTWTIEESETFDVTVDDGGTHVAMVIGGVGHVTIE